MGCVTKATALAGCGAGFLQLTIFAGGGVGGAERDRTADLLIANEALSQLSYGPNRGRKIHAPGIEWASFTAGASKLSTTANRGAGPPASPYKPL